MKSTQKTNNIFLLQRLLNSANNGIIRTGKPWHYFQSVGNFYVCSSVEIHPLLARRTAHALAVESFSKIPHINFS